MVNAKHGGTRVKSVVSQNGTGSVIRFIGTDHGRRDRLTQTELPEMQSRPPRFTDMRHRNGAEHPEISNAERNGRHRMGEALKAIFDRESRTLSEIPKTLDTSALEHAVNALVQARRICCYAIGTSALLANEAEYQFVRLGLSCISLNDRMQLAIQSTLLARGDVVLFFSRSGRDRRTIEGIGLARRTGATTVSVTSDPNSPLAKRSDIALVLPERPMSSKEVWPPSKIPELALLNVLATYVALYTRKQMVGSSRCDELMEKMLIQ